VAAGNVQTPNRGEVWLVDFGTGESQSARPAVVLSTDAAGAVPLRLVAPVASWKDGYSGSLWHVKIDAAAGTGLARASMVDAMHLHGIEANRFLQKLGRISSTTMEEIATAIAIMVEYC
jgi:mRNA interferase MazF